MTGRNIRLLLMGVIAVLIVVIALISSSSPRQSSPPKATELPKLSVVPEFQLLDQSGTQVTQQTLRGRPWVASFIFTRCALSCPRMVSAIKRLEAELPADSRVRQVSVSVDPDHDRPEVLANYAEAHQIVSPDWLFLTGDFEQIRSLSIEGFKLGFDAPPDAAADSVEAPIIHSTRLALVDSELSIRGYYDPFDQGGIDRLVSDIAAVELESRE